MRTTSSSLAAIVPITRCSCTNESSRECAWAATVWPTWAMPLVIPAKAPPLPCRALPSSWTRRPRAWASSSRIIRLVSSVKSETSAGTCVRSIGMWAPFPSLGPVPDHTGERST